MWVDGAAQPTWEGTGLEDYFNGGWYYRGSVFGALNASYDRSPFRVAQYRHQHPDPVHFDQSFRMEFERMSDPQTGAAVRGVFQSVAYLYLDRPTPVAPVPTAATDRLAVADPFYPTTLLIQLLELERANDFTGALRMVQEYLERFPDAEDAGVYALRALEYRRWLGESIAADEMAEFLDGTHGASAQAQAQLLAWFYDDPGRALLAMNVNGFGQLYLNGRTVLTGDHPYQLFVTGVELEPGTHQLAAQVEMRRHEPWFQAGLRTHTGVAGTGMNTLSSLTLETGWRTATVQPPRWHAIGIRDIPRGAPDAPYVGGEANAFILIQSKTYPVRALDWGYHQGVSYYRQDLVLPLAGWPAFSLDMTGLTK